MVNLQFLDLYIDCIRGELIYDSAMTKLMYAHYIIIADRSLEHQLTRETDNIIEL